ncbi:MAG: hypothetical protein ACE5GZ_05015 [Gammaproteobacteria bacterium]
MRIQQVDTGEYVTADRELARLFVIDEAEITVQLTDKESEFGTGRARGLSPRLSPLTMEITTTPGMDSLIGRRRPLTTAPARSMSSYGFHNLPGRAASITLIVIIHYRIPPRPCQCFQSSRHYPMSTMKCMKLHENVRKVTGGDDLQGRIQSL